MSQTKTYTINGPNRNQILEEADGGEALAVEAAVIAVMIAETTQLQINIHSKEKWKIVQFAN